MKDFFEIIKDSKPTLIDFYATWCGPCKMQAPVIEQVKEEVGDNANVLKIDIDNNQALARQYRVMSIPTLMIFKDGEVVWRESGLKDRNFIVKKLNEFMTATSEA